MADIGYIVNVEAAIYKENKWCIIKRSMKEEHAAGLLSLVGGKVETTEIRDHILEDTIVKEIKEEIGIDIYQDMTYLESKSFLTDQKKLVIDIVFLCEYKDGQIHINDYDEVEAIYWMDMNEIIMNHHAPIYLKETITKAEKVRKKVY